MLLIFVFILKFISTFSDQENQTWSYVHECDPKTWTECPAKDASRFNIYHFIQLKNGTYNSFVLTFFDRPRILMAQTIHLCHLDINYSIIVRGVRTDAIYFKFANKSCNLSKTTDQLIFESLVEIEESSVVKEHKLLIVDSVKGKPDNHFSVSATYLKYITLNFTFHDKIKKQSILPFYTLGPSKILISLMVEQLETKSINSNFFLDFHISSTRSKLKYIEKTSPFDIDSFGVFKSFEVMENTDSNHSQGNLSFYWRGVGYTSVERRRSSSVFAVVEHFNATAHAYDFFFPQVNLTSHYQSRIGFISKSIENCFFKKKLLIWDATFGTFGEPDTKLTWIIKLIMIAIYVVTAVLTLIVFVSLCIHLFRKRSGYQIIPAEENVLE
ncbi:hypothetical protein RF11_02281 [Thelohanellus kitauei]|uniref:Uncharacterized protein n=1 Tax=Thelohanellus kitauei TaxID=669202 RepID=A0A0C2M907_THEKT|nr:hypothetical protein RF11_02281 [Thelohanellus kitauei]